MSLAKIISKDRKRREMGLEEYGEFLSKFTDTNFRAPNISDIEKGLRSMSYNTLEKLQKPLGVSLGILLWHKGVLPDSIRDIEFSNDEISEIIRYALNLKKIIEYKF